MTALGWVGFAVLVVVLVVLDLLADERRDHIERMRADD